MMKKTFVRNAVAAAVGAVFMGCGAGAMAAPIATVIDLTTKIGAQTYASELIGPTAVLTNAGNLNSSAKLGFGVSQGQTLFVRVDLTNATLNSAMNSGSLTVYEGAVAIADNAVTGGSVALVQGGTSGTYAIFQITAIAAATQAATVGIAPGNVNVPSTASNAGMTYSLYADSPSAVNQLVTGRLAGPTSADIAKFGKALSFMLTPGTQTAAVVDLYTKFKGTPSNSTGPVALGTMTYGVTGALNPTLGTPATIPQLLTAANAVVEGDFSAFSPAPGSMFLASGPGCTGTTTSPTSIAADKKSATFALPATGPFGPVEVCVTANGTTAIPAQSVTSRLDVTALAGTSTSNVAAASQGTILRDGTVLKVPFIYGGNYTGGAQSTSVNLANTSSLPASYTTRCFGTAGPVTPTGSKKAGTIAAGSTLRVYLSDLGCGTTANAVEFTFAVPEGTVVGTMVRTNSTTGDSGYSDLTGNQ